MPRLGVIMEAVCLTIVAAAIVAAICCNHFDAALPMTLVVVAYIWIRTR